MQAQLMQCTPILCTLLNTVTR